jgi:hypothetical protein
MLPAGTYEDHISWFTLTCSHLVIRTVSSVQILCYKSTFSYFPICPRILSVAHVESMRISLARPRREAFVNGLHDFLGPPHRVCDCAHCYRNSLPALELCQLAGRENTRRDQQNAFAAFLQVRSLSFSCFVRLRRKINRHRCEITGVEF